LPGKGFRLAMPKANASASKAQIPQTPWALAFINSFIPSKEYLNPQFQVAANV
jgi:hypothetical protein